MAPMSIPAIESSSEPAYTGPGAPPPVATANAAKTATAAIPMPGRARQSDASRVFLIDPSPSESGWRVRGRAGPAPARGSGCRGGEHRRCPAGVGPAVGLARGQDGLARPSRRGCAGYAHGPAARGDPRTHAVGDPHERPCDGVAGEREGDLEQEA